MVPMCFSRTDASTDMQHDLRGVTRDLTWPWPEAKFWHWPFKAKMCILRRVLTSGARCCQDYVTSFPSSKVICKKKHFSKKRYFDLYWPLWPYPLKLGQFWGHVGERDFKGLSSFFFRGLLSIVGSEIMTRFRKNNMTLRQNWALVTSGDLNIDLSEKMTKTFSIVLIRRNRTFFPRPSISLSFWVKSCGHFDPPPLTRAKVAGTATRARVNAF